MKDFTGNIEGLKVIYDGDPIEYSDGTKLKRGKYVVEFVRGGRVYLKCDRKNATTRYFVYESDFKVKELEWADLTTQLFWVFNHPKWVVNNEELIKKAKAYNRR